ncbi:MAG TPA: hypothetical protein VHL31_04535, partial [Geminicoccus sp.]|uniref:class I SAM-dependent RNA methyltransferase n=1 Tax=Geminicoccus sp. TaxID=2024832 RepID=UPI002E37804C
MNETLDVRIDHVGSKGDGIVLGQDGRLFVEGALAGERALVRPLAGRDGGDRRAVLVEILEPSAERVIPPCPHAGPCGACRLQHLSLPAYGRFLEEKVKAALHARGLDPALVRPAALSPPADRRRVRLAWQREGSGTVLGTRMPRSHRIVDLATCLVARQELMAVLPGLRRLLGRIAPASGEVALDLTEAGVDVLIIATQSPSTSDRTRIAAAFAELPSLCRIAWRSEKLREVEVLLSRSEPIVQHGPLRLAPTPGAFRQATAHGEAAMHVFLQEHLGGARNVVDLFGGIGSLGLSLAPLPRRLQVVEGDLAAVDTLRRAIAGGVKGCHITALRRDLHKEPMTARELRE